MKEIEGAPHHSGRLPVFSLAERIALSIEHMSGDALVAFQTPVLFLIFNRPDKTERVFEQIRQAQPSCLFVAADGPRSTCAADFDLCTETRRIVLQGIDWPCEVHTLFRETNLGCKLAISSAIDWFFENAEEGIILEDDCLPDPTFFPFCAELLERYRHDERIMMISGDKFHSQLKMEHSYDFCRFPHIWGWATWRRAWKHYDLDLGAWPGLKNNPGFMSFLQHSTRGRAGLLFDRIHEHGSSSWDFQWLFSCWAANGFSITPAINLVRNIDHYGTHMKPYDPAVNLDSGSMPFPLRHPQEISANTLLDRHTERYLFLRTPLQTLNCVLRLLGKTLISRPRHLASTVLSVVNSLKQEVKKRKPESSR